MGVSEAAAWGNVYNTLLEPSHEIMSDSAAQPPDASDSKQITNREWREQWHVDVNIDPWDIPLSEINPGHDAYHQANKALPLFARLRAEAPVHLTEESQFGPYWNITNFEDCQYVDSNQVLFSSDSRNGGIRLGGRPMTEEPNPMFHLPMFIMEDQPKHDDQRKVVAPLFTPKRLASLSDLIRKRASAILDNLPANEDFNWVRRVSVELTGQMLATLLGIPQEDRHKLIHWSDTVERIGDPDYFETPAEGFAELWKCFEYFNDIWQERQQAEHPGDDLISYLAHNDATRKMPPNEFLGNMLLLIVGGNDTTRNSISGGVLALNQFPSEYAKLEVNHDLIPNMVPEIIRWQSPVAHMCRTAMEDTEIGGQKIAKWDKVCMWYVSGNRDDSKIENPNALVIDRPNARHHLSFGFGIHRCLGNRLAEMQLKIIWEEILKRFKQVEVIGEPQYLKSSFIRGITELPVRVHPR